MVFAEMVLASSPHECHKWTKGSYIFDENGGVFYSSKHDVTVIIPEGAIKSGLKAELQFGATLFASVEFSKNMIPVSDIIWLCLNVTLQKPVQVQIPHCVNIKSKVQANKLQFVKVAHLSIDGGLMKPVNGGKFPIGKVHGFIEIDHFCYYCIVNDNIGGEDIDYHYSAFMFMRRQLYSDTILDFHICISTSLSTCREVRT